MMRPNLAVAMAGRAHAVRHDLDYALSRASNLGVSTNHGHGRAAAMTIEHANAIRHELDDALQHAVPVDYERALYQVKIIEREWAVTKTARTSLDHASAIQRDLDYAAARAATLTTALTQIRAARRQRRIERGTSCTTRLLAAAVLLLPASDRVRYAEEYWSELQDLALAGNGGIRQLRYGLRQLRSAPSMSFALRSPRRRSAAS